MPHTHADQNYAGTGLADLRAHLRTEHDEAHLSLHDLQWGPRTRLENMHRGVHPEAPQFEPSVSLKIYPGSITIREFRQLRDGADEARNKGTITWLRNAAGDPVAAIVPVQVARQAVTDAGARGIARDDVIRVKADDGEPIELLVRSVHYYGAWEVTLDVVPHPEEPAPVPVPNSSLGRHVLQHLRSYGEGSYGPSAWDLALIFCATASMSEACLASLKRQGFVTSRHIHDYTSEPARWELTGKGRKEAALHD